MLSESTEREPLVGFVDRQCRHSIEFVATALWAVRIQSLRTND